MAHHHSFFVLILAFAAAIPLLADEPKHTNTTGFFVSSAGHVLTQLDSRPVTVIFNDQKYPAKVVSRDRETGLMLLKIDAKQDTPFLTLAETPKIELGDSIFSIGFPDVSKSRSPRYSKGSIYSLVGNNDDERFLEVQASLGLGNNGAAIINQEERVIGILSIKNNTPSVSHTAVRSNLAMRLIQMIPQANFTTQKKENNISRVRRATVALTHTPKTTTTAPIPTITSTPPKPKPKPTPPAKPTIVKAIPIEQSAQISELTLEQQIDLFLNNYYLAMSKGNIDKVSTMLSSQNPDLYSRHQAFLEDWPIRKFVISNSSVTEAFFDQIEAKVEYQYTKIDQQGQAIKGSATNYFTIQNRQSGFRIFETKHIDNSNPAPAATGNARVGQIITSYMVQGSTGGKGSSHLFADSIDYYGSRKSRSQAKIDETNYNRKWPNRYYMPIKPHQISPTPDGRFYANAYSRIGASNGRTHRIIDVTSSFIIKPTDGFDRSIEKIWISSTKERKVNADEFKAFCQQCTQR